MSMPVGVIHKELTGTALGSLGHKRVFSTSFGALEAHNEKHSELMESLKNSNSLSKRLELNSIRKRDIKEEERQNQRKQKQSFKQNFRTIGRILKLGRPDLKLFLLALSFILFAVLYPTALVKLVGEAIDAFNNKTLDEDGDLLIWGYKYSTIFTVMVPFMVVSATCFWARIWVLKVLGERLVARLRLRVMKHLLRHDAAFYDQEKHKVGDLISRLSSDAYVVSRSITSNLPDGMKNVLFGIISSYMMYQINPILFGVMLLISPPITIGSVWYGERIRQLSTRLQNATAGLTKVSEETLNAVKLVQAFSSEPKELSKYSDQVRNVIKIARKEALAQSNYSVSIYSLYHTGYLSCIALGMYLILQGKMSTGDVVAFTMYSEFFNMALYSLTTTYMELMKGAGAGVKLFNLIDYHDDVNPVKGERVPENLGKDIEFRDVVFSYPTRQHNKIFRGCSFYVPPASSTCFVAPSGCGKSTIALLLLRAYNIESGQIFIGGKDIKEFQIRDLRRSVIAIVQQEPVLLSGSILENIVYGLTPAQINQLTMDDVIEVAKQANCHDFITALPDGYDTLIGSRGASLSGGQKQRVAIARALIKKPAILILDEATSALDSKSESLINNTLKNLTSEGKMTIISIAHRLSTISKSENVVVLGKKGKVVEQGRFVELFSDPNSELSKLLDESSSQKKEDDERNAEQERLDKEAKEIELRQRIQRGEFELLRSLIADLPESSKVELVKQIEQELAEEEESYEEEESTSQVP
ncbi:ATP-dependent permease MDL2 mitochondrial [Meyerozyma sp. JA9]|nr:ATP-dependent permease MDL2 mitochondrial [Meyerozyma sp. JA9]